MVSTTTIFFATDIHGSERTWKKLVAAGKFYDVDSVVLGGDLTGKAVLAIVDQGDGSYKAEFMGATHVLRSRDEIEELERHIRTLGYYPYRTDRKEFAEMQESPELASKIFDNCVVETMKNWLEYADQKLEGTDLHIYVSPGNDDDFFIDPLLAHSKRVINVEGEVISIGEHNEMLTTGYSNPTPWKTPRELPEDQLRQKIEGVIAKIKNMPAAIFNTHAPPYGTLLDDAPVLDKNMKPTQAGMSRMSVGSTAVLELIKKYQPLLGLHGHIHESKGSARVGRTLCLNPGSEYGDGSLLGSVLEFDNDKLKRYFATSG